MAYMPLYILWQIIAQPNDHEISVKISRFHST